MSEANVWHVNQHAEGAVYIGRQDRNHKRSPFANPFKIGNEHPRTKQPMTRGDVVALYQEWIVTRPDIMRQLPELRGKDLECWCRTGDVKTWSNQCHGDVLLYLLDTYTDEQLRGWT